MAFVLCSFAKTRMNKTAGNLFFPAKSSSANARQILFLAFDADQTIEADHDEDFVDIIGHIDDGKVIILLFELGDDS